MHAYMQQIHLMAIKYSCSTKRWFENHQLLLQLAWMHHQKLDTENPKWMIQQATRPNSLAQSHGLFEDNPHNQNQQELELT
jgi:hypothetical protein